MILESHHKLKQKREAFESSLDGRVDSISSSGFLVLGEKAVGMVEQLCPVSERGEPSGSSLWSCLPGSIAVSRLPCIMPLATPPLEAPEMPSGFPPTFLCFSLSLVFIFIFPFLSTFQTGPFSSLWHNYFS